MSSSKALTVLAALSVLAARSQDIAPEVLQFSRIRDHVRAELAYLPNYTCLETVQRFHKTNGSKETMKAVDLVRLEVLYLMGSGMFATFLHGARRTGAGCRYPECL